MSSAVDTDESGDEYAASELDELDELDDFDEGPAVPGVTEAQVGDIEAHIAKRRGTEGRDHC
jgi:hypothetical protein